MIRVLVSWLTLRRWREHYEYCPYAGQTWFLPRDALEVREEEAEIERELVEAGLVETDENQTHPPLVFIGVEGGVADWTALGGVDVILLDWDNVKADPEYAREKLEELANLGTRLLDDHSLNYLTEAARIPEEEP